MGRPWKTQHTPHGSAQVFDTEAQLLDSVPQLGTRGFEKLTGKSFVYTLTGWVELTSTATQPAGVLVIAPTRTTALPVTAADTFYKYNIPVTTAPSDILLPAIDDVNDTKVVFIKRIGTSNKLRIVPNGTDTIDGISNVGTPGGKLIENEDGVFELYADNESTPKNWLIA